MNQLESFLQNPPPLAEAAAFLVRLRGEKTASVKEVIQGLEELPAEERASVLKTASALPLLVSAGQMKKANMLSGQPPTMGPAAKGQNMAPPAPISLPSTAMGANSKVAKAASPEDVGRERGKANTAAHFERESHRHGERAGTSLGRVAGLAAGAAGAHHLGKGNPLASIAGAALGQHVGASLGRSAGKASDERHYTKHASALFKEALEEAGIQPQITPEMAEYLAAEQAADGQAAGQQLAMVRQKLQEAVAAQQAAEERSSQLEATQATTDQTLAQYQAQVADATQKAMGAQDEVLSNQQAAAAMRMAYQQLRGQLLQAASTDPPSLSGNEAALAAASTAAGPNSGPPGQSGAAGGAPNPGTPNTVAPEGDDQVSRPVQPNEPMFQNATNTTYAGNKEQQDHGDAKIPGKEVLSSVRLPFVYAEKLSSLRELLGQQIQEAAPAMKRLLPHALVGGALGAGLGFAESRGNNESLRKKVQELEAKGDDRSVGDAMNLALSRGRLTLGEHAEKHPAAATMTGALMGATTGARGGPAFVEALKSLKNDAVGIGKDVKTLIQK